MEGILPVVSFIAGFALAWFVLRSRKRESEAALRELSADAVAKNTQALASVVAPVHASLEKVDSKIQELEKSRAGAYAALHEQVRSMLETQSMLRTETGRLVTALRTPHVRGNWGEIQLRRVVEMAGMLEHCDFDEQVHTDGDEGRLRPDMVVHMPGAKRASSTPRCLCKPSSMPPTPPTNRPGRRIS
jgi:DNA recombination protein RmuC